MIHNNSIGAPFLLFYELHIILLKRNEKWYVLLIHSLKYAFYLMQVI